MKFIRKSLKGLGEIHWLYMWFTPERLVREVFFFASLTHRLIFVKRFTVVFTKIDLKEYPGWDFSEISRIFWKINPWPRLWNECNLVSKMMPLNCVFHRRSYMITDDIIVYLAREAKISFKSAGIVKQQCKTQYWDLFSLGGLFSIADHMMILLGIILNMNH